MSKQAKQRVVGDADPADPNADGEISPVARVARAAFKQLPPHDIHPAGAKWSTWSVVAHADHSIEDVLNPRYLYGKAEHIGALDVIEVKHPFGLYVVVLDVVRVDRAMRGIVSHVRHIFDYTANSTRTIMPDVSGANVQFLGDRQWSVVDGHHVIKDQFPTRAAADGYLAEMRRL